MWIAAGSAAGQKRALERQPAARATKVPRRMSADGISEAHNKTPIAQAALHQTPQGVPLTTDPPRRLRAQKVWIARAAGPVS